MAIFKFALVDATHNVLEFRCGNKTIDEYFHGPARQDSHWDVTKTFVATAAIGADNQPLGFFTLKTTCVDIPSQTTPGFKTTYEPAEILYLARDLRVRRMGLGDALLAEALAKIVEASERVGIPGIYERFSL
jgi:ribosomal protein S18 acetylase RimI-like enzyme